MNTNISRRFFIGGAASLGAFGGCRFFSCHDYRAGGTPNVRFGVISDIHLLGAKCDNLYMGDDTTLVHTLKWFRDQGVDAVLIAGDMADKGLDEDLQAVANAWFKVFPDDRAPDGRKVERVFVYGNHDWEGFCYGDYGKKRFPDKDELNRHLLRNDYAGWWERIFHEEYKPIYLKQIKGYSFIGQHWDRQGWGSACTFDRIRPFMDKVGPKLDPSLPFFYVQHPHPKDTCYGSWAWGHDTGIVSSTLSAYPNAVAFSGHSHYSLTDERSVWQGAFTSVGTSSLRYTGMPYDELPPAGYENAGAPDSAEAWRYNAVKLMPSMERADCRQGMLWSVYDDCIVVKRREFLSDLDVGDDWVLPLSTAESKPFAFVERAKKFAAPSFVAGSQVVVSRASVKNRGGSKGKEKVPAVTKACYKVLAPEIVADRNARGYDLEFVAEAKDGSRKVKRVMAEGFNHATTHRKAKARTCCYFAEDELSSGPVRFLVTPLGCFGQRGATVSVAAPAKTEVRS